MHPGTFETSSWDGQVFWDALVEESPSWEAFTGQTHRQSQGSGWVEAIHPEDLSNALKHGAGRPVRIHVTKEGQRARVTVRDEGIGIAPEHLPRVFDRFARGVSERHYGGLGLGLYMTRRSIEALGGTVGVESRPGEGALFTVELPLRPPGEDERP
ncbi:sensor histidine kinase [Archangium violaceum]|nr:sensor histidine kinase [Archangium violaceum]